MIFNINGLREHYLYDISSPSCLVRAKNINKYKKGEHVGTLRKDGYYKVSYKGTKLSVHRVVWMLHHGDIPEGMQIDHINRDSTDNRIENLRMVTCKENQQNRQRKAVYYNKTRDGWDVRVNRDGKRIYYAYGCKTEGQAKVIAFIHDLINPHYRK